MIPLISADCNYKEPFIPDFILHKPSIQNNNNSISDTGKDRVNISEKAMKLFIQDCDNKDCEFKWIKQNAEFEFNYSENSLLRINGNGVTYQDSFELDVNAEFTFQSGTAGDNASVRFFKATLCFHVSVKRNLSVNPYEKKEDILSLVRRVVNTVLRTVLDKDKDLAGIIFDPEDYKELAALEHGTFLKKFEAIIQAIIINTKVLHMIKGEKQGEQVFILPKRAKSHRVRIEFSEAVARDFEFKIEEIEGNVQGFVNQEVDQSSGLSVQSQPVNTLQSAVGSVLGKE